MFSWFRKADRPPPPAAENPGRGHDVLVAFKNSRRTWEETDDLVSSLAATLNKLGHKASAKRDWVKLDAFKLVPRVVSVEPLDDAGVNTVTTIQISHPALTPRGVFEYQHSSGTDLRDSFAKGFQGWAEFDLPVFLDALREKAAVCMTLTMEPSRRLVLGPTIQMAQKTNPAPGEHDFCPCCLFTKNVDAFGELLQGQDFHAIRFFVTRDAQGHVEADCRVNGVDHAAAAASLVRYGQTWPDRGVEYRKQYVCIQTREPATS